MGKRVRPVPLAEATPAVQQRYAAAFGEGVDPTAVPGTGKGDGPGHDGITGDINTTFALVPGAIEDFQVLVLALLRFDNERPLSPALRELAVLRVAVVTNCKFMYSSHVRAGKRAGLSDEKVANVKGWASSDLYDEAERAVMAAADDLVSRRTIEDVNFENLKRHLSDTEIVEMCFAITAYKLGSLFVRGLELEYDTDTTSRLPAIDAIA